MLSLLWHSGVGGGAGCVSNGSDRGMGLPAVFEPDANVDHGPACG